jgi:acetylornithine deacetylase/succinyl-diaminopimelate desuccinylase-like protein
MIARACLAGVAIASLTLPAMAAETDWASRMPDPTQEVTSKLSTYLQVNTTNPPGNEVQAASLLAGWIRAEGIEATTYESAPGRANVVARLKGSGAERPLLLLNHMDVVPVEESRWKQPPFSGKVVDGQIWGRGALDMKDIGLMELMAFFTLKRLGVPLKRDVIFCGVADEEVGGEQGAQWMLAHHREAIDASEALNEGAMGVVFPNGATVVGINSAERGALWVKVTATGPAGHGSVYRSDESTVRLLRALNRIQTLSGHLELTPETREMMPAMALGQSGAARWILSHLEWPFVLGAFGSKIVEQSPVVGALLSTSFNPTMLRAGDKVNVVPGEASAMLDVRILPGQTVAGTLDRMKQVVDDPSVKFDVDNALEPSASPMGTGLFSILSRSAQAEYPQAKIAPMLSTGSTDSGFLRHAGINCYGYCPILVTPEQLSSIHGDNEFITIDQLSHGTRATFRAIAAACAQ